MEVGLCIEGCVVQGDYVGHWFRLLLPYSQNFNTLAVVNTSTFLPAGWEILEGGGGTFDDEKYTADDGASNTGDTYSYGTGASTERALGSLQSTSLTSTFGVFFVNSSGVTITSLDISYVGEQWREGATGTDALDFQYSLDATALAGGTWIDANALDFQSPSSAGGGHATTEMRQVFALLSHRRSAD